MTPVSNGPNSASPNSGAQRSSEAQPSSDTQLGGLAHGAQIIQNLPWRWPVHGKIFLIGGLGFMFDAWDVALNGVLIPLVAAEWSLALPQAGWLATANLAGMAVGALVWGAIADRIGRKAAFSATLLTFAIFTVAGALAPDFLWFCAFRFLAGFGLGGCIPVDYALVSEFTPKKNRGTVLAALDGWWPIGAALGFFSSAAILGLTGQWRLILLVMVLPALLTVWVRLAVPESPLYLAATGKGQRAREVIDQLVSRTGTAPQQYTLETTDDSTDNSEAKPAKRSIISGFARQLRDIWAYNWRLTVAAWSLSVSILLVYYVALNWMPSILIAAGLGSQTAFFINGAMAAAGLFGVLIAALGIEKLGRKLILAITGPLSALLLAITAWTLPQAEAAVAWLIVFGVVVQIAIPVLYTYLSEMYPTQLRASGFGVASTLSRLGAGFGPLLFAAALWPLVGIPVSFLLAGALIVLAVIWTARFAPETRNQELG